MTPEKIQCIILAGGLATRMKALTKTIPKALLPIGKVPFVDLQLQWLAGQGVTDVVFCIGHRGQAIREVVGNGERWGLRVTYVDEGENLRGTGGALRLALDRGALESRFFVTYGDSYLPVDFRAMWRSHGEDEQLSAHAVMTVFKNEGRLDASNVSFSPAAVLSGSGWIRSYDKDPAAQTARGLVYDYIDYGLLILTDEIVRRMIPAQETPKIDLAECLKELSHAGLLRGVEVPERFYEIGSPSGLEDLRRLFGHS